MSNNESDKTISGRITDMLNEQQRLAAAIAPPAMSHLAQLRRATNPAEWMHERLGKYVKEFESKLDENHEIGGRLVSFGQSVTFHIERVGYYGPDIISFEGMNENGERIQLIQHISQLSVLLVAMKKLQDKPRRIGYIWDEQK